MFVKVGNRHINMDNVGFIEQPFDNIYKVHLISNENAPITINAGVLGDSSFADLRAFLKSQGASGAVAAGKEE